MAGNNSSSSIRGFIVYCSLLVIAVFIQSALANDGNRYEDSSG